MHLPFQSSAPVQHLRRRAELAKELRSFFDERGFVEVHTPILSRYCIIDRHLDPIRVPAASVGVGRDNTDWYLQTSPEQSMKRLLASGIGDCYQLGPVFRSGEFGQFHNPEFTMAEWYEVGAGLEAGLTLLDELCQRLLATPMAERVRFADAFQHATNMELFETTNESLGAWCVERGWVDSDSWSADWDDWVNVIFSMAIQPSLGHHRPVLITHFPASQAALAQLDPTDSRTAERYELFYRGVELANGYHELLSGTDLRGRAALANDQRVKDGKFPLPIENPLLDAMEHGLPASCGCALGFDRVVMLACGASRLEEVCAFTTDRA
jgi:lysyl-tRNA synthetase class 2